MRWFYKCFLRRLLFVFDAGRMHNLAILGLDWAGKCRIVCSLMRWFFCFNDERLVVLVQGIRFPNPVLIPAGYSKDGRGIAGIVALGYGGEEIGSVTKDPWRGNPEPCLDRIVEYECLANRKGFNNSGAEKTAEIVVHSEGNVPIGISFTLSPDPSVVDPLSDLIEAILIAGRSATFIVIDIGCPNVYNGRFLLEPENLSDFLARVRPLKEELGLPPIWVKLPPDLSEEELVATISACLQFGIKTVVLGNTAKDHNNCGLPSAVSEQVKNKLGGECGLSGKLLFPRTLRNIRVASRLANGKLTIVACGGISSGEDAWQCICAGASLVQVLTGLIYEGPVLIRDINRYLLCKTQKHGLDSITEAVGREDLSN